MRIFLSINISFILHIYIQIYKLIRHIVNIDYDIFRPGNLENWQASLEYFQKHLNTVEQESKTVLDHCIQSLRYNKNIKYNPQNMFDYNKTFIYFIETHIIINTYIL